MILIDDKVWAGSEGTHEFVLNAIAAMSAKVDQMAFNQNQEDEDDNEPRLLSIDENGLATIEIKGPLVNSESPFLQYFGMTGYPEIRDALVSAAKNTEVKQILLDVDSGGGQVSGVADTAALIRNIHSNVKPVTTFTDGTMASAAYWLGSAAGEVFSGKTAMVGSIGVIATHKEYSEAFKKEGVGVTVVRAGKDKALANPNEKLTAKGKDQIQQMVDASYTVFVEHVAEMRDKSYAYADKQMADGQEFIGRAALDVGLIDGVTTFDAVVTDLKEKIIASSGNLMQNRAKGGSGLYKASTEGVSTTCNGDKSMAKKPLSEQEVAALAAGATIEATASPIENEAAAAVGSTEQPAAAAETTETTDVAAAAAAESNVDTSAATVQLLMAQLKDKDAALLEAGIKVAKLEEKLIDAEATHGPLVTIAARALGNMQVALGGSALSVEGMSATAILAEHDRVSKVFASKFKVGGVAAVGSADGGDSVKKSSFVATNVTQAQIRAIHGK